MSVERPTPLPEEPEPPARLKMKDLEARTGVGRETIRFYIREGLLPEPERPARNVAWYDEAFVERIRFIKELQEKRYLPLSVIRRIVADDEELSRAEVDALLELDFFALFDLDVDTNKKKVNKAFLDLAQTWHPDRVQGRHPRLIAFN